MPVEIKSMYLNINVGGSHASGKKEDEAEDCCDEHDDKNKKKAVDLMEGYHDAVMEVIKNKSER